MPEMQDCCVEQVHNDSGVSFHQCRRRGKFEHKGNMYCKQHYPPNVEKRNADYRAKWEAEAKERSDRRGRQEREREELQEDRARLDFLTEKGTKGLRWIARQSTMGRGLRLHQDTGREGYDTPRQAIDAMRKKNLEAK